MDAGCSLLVFQPPRRESRARLLADGGLSVWQRSSRKHTANWSCARTDAAAAGDVGDVNEMGSRAHAEAALRLVEGPLTATAGCACACACACQGDAIDLSGQSRWAAIKGPLNRATL